MRKSMTALAAALMAVTLGAQQIELNDAGGSLTRVTSNPIPGTPFTVYQGTAFDFRVSGAPNSGYILVLGNLATSSTQLPILNNQWLDLDQATAQVLGDGITYSSPNPGEWFITDAFGRSNWSIPVNLAMAGGDYDLQAIVSDATLPPFNLNLTAAGRWTISGAALLGTLVGDDSGLTVTSAHSYPLYGAGRTQFGVSTNGNIRLGAIFSTDLSETAAEMIAGNPNAITPAAPMIAVDWEDLDMGNNATQAVQIYEDIVNNELIFRWVNGEFYVTSANWGNIECRIQDLGGFCQVELDYTSYLPAPAPSEGLVGISDGNIGGATGIDTQADIVVAGAVVPFTSTADYQTYFQNFDGTGTTPIGPIDVAGTLFTFLDLTGFGQWLIY